MPKSTRTKRRNARLRYIDALLAGRELAARDGRCCLVHLIPRHNYMRIGTEINPIQIAG